MLPIRHTGSLLGGTLAELSRIVNPLLGRGGALATAGRAPSVTPLTQALVIVVCIGGATAIRASIGLAAEGITPFPTYHPAIAIVGLLAGLRAGAIALAISVAIGWWLFLATSVAFNAPTGTELTNAVIFAVAASIELAIAVLLREALWRIRRSEVRHKTLVQATTTVVSEFDPSGRCLEPQPSWEALTGMQWPDYRNYGWLKAVHPDDHAAIDFRRGEADTRQHVAEARIWDRTSGDWRWYSVREVALTSADGSIEAWIAALTDIHERRIAREQRELQLGEARHRLKNLAAIIEALCNNSRPRNDPAVEAYAAKLIARLRALQRAADLVVAYNWQAIDIADTVKTALAPFLEEGESRVVVAGGPPVALGEQTSGGVALALHELGTNALKYGALSVEGGTVEVSWRLEPVDGGERVVLDWRESGGPPAVAPTREGFGSRVIRLAVAREKDHQVTVDYTPDGLRCRMSFLRSTTATA